MAAFARARDPTEHRLMPTVNRRGRVATAAALLVVAGAGAFALVRGREGDALHGEVNVSRARGPQNQPAAAIDPRDPQILIAGSNSFSETTLRAYTSTDGGATWTSEQAPQAPLGKVAPDDPALAIDLDGRQYYAFIAEENLNFPSPRVYVATRAGPHDRWRTRPETVDSTVAGVAPESANYKETIAVDRSPTSPRAGRVYLAWSRDLHWSEPPRSLFSIQISHSDDAGRTWSRPSTVTSSAQTLAAGVSIGTAADGGVYAAWTSERGIFIAKSTDGVTFGRARRVVALPLDPRFSPAVHRRLLIPAMPTTLEVPRPTVIVDDARGRVAVAYTRVARDGARDVWLTSYDRTLRRRFAHRRVHPPDGPVASDQFAAAAAYDPDTGDVWVCYYDTRGDLRRIETRFTCTVSTDGAETFRPPVPAASVASDESGPLAAHGPSGREYGDYQAVVAADGVAHPFWTDSRHLRTLREEIYTTALAADD